jgi:hypothetical protein
MSINQDIEKQIAYLEWTSAQAVAASETWNIDETEANWQRYEKAQESYLMANSQLVALVRAAFKTGYRLVDVKGKST